MTLQKEDFIMTKQKWMRKVSATILTTTLAVASLGSGPKVYAAENEVGSTTIYTVGQQAKGTLDNNEEVDYYSFTTDGSDSFYEFSFANTGVNGDTYYSIYKDVDLVEEITSDSIGYKNSGYYNFVKLEQNHTYYVKVSGNNTGSYQFKITKTEDDVKETGQQPEIFAVGKEVTRILQNNEDIDCFSFTTDGSDSFYEFSFTNTGVDGETYYSIYKDGDLVEEITSGSIGYKNSGYYNFVKLEQNHTYYVKVSGNTTGSYRFKVTKTKDDVKDTAKGAKTIKLNTTNSFVLQNEKDVDVFKFTTTNYTNYTLRFSNDTINGDAYIQVFSGKDCLNNQMVCEQSLGNKSSLAKSDASLKLKRFKTYYIKITGAKGKYKVGISATAPESLKVAKAKSKQVSLKWKKVSDATGYEIYRAQGKNGKYKKIKTIKKTGIETYVDKEGLKKGKTYVYKIRAYKKVNGKTYYSTFSSEKSIKVK